MRWVCTKIKKVGFGLVYIKLKKVGLCLICTRISNVELVWFEYATKRYVFSWHEKPKGKHGLGLSPKSKELT